MYVVIGYDNGTAAAGITYRLWAESMKTTWWQASEPLRLYFDDLGQRLRDWANNLEWQDADDHRGMVRMAGDVWIPEQDFRLLLRQVLASKELAKRKPHSVSIIRLGNRYRSRSPPDYFVLATWSFVLCPEVPVRGTSGPR